MKVTFSDTQYNSNGIYKKTAEKVEGVWVY